MATKMTANGVSTTATPGTEQYKVFYTGYRTRRKKHYQYDYRHTNGELFPMWQTLSTSADAVVTDGSTKNNNISQVVI